MLDAQYTRLCRNFQSVFCYHDWMRILLLSVVLLAILGGALWWLSSVRETPRNFPPKNPTIVAFGDSLVSGQGASAGKDFVSQLSVLLQRPIINRGVPGETTAQGRARLPEITAEGVGTVIVLLGGNDYLKRIPEDETFENLRVIVTTLQSSGSMVVLLGVRGGLFNDHYDARFEALAKETDALYVPDVLRGLIGDASLMSDAVHPNDAGYQRIAQRVFEELAPYLAP